MVAKIFDSKVGYPISLHELHMYSKGGFLVSYSYPSIFFNLSDNIQDLWATKTGTSFKLNPLSTFFSLTQIYSLQRWPKTTQN